MSKAGIPAFFICVFLEGFFCYNHGNIFDMKKTMKLKFIIAAISALFSTALFAQWQPVGNAEYTWGPFHVTLSACILKRVHTKRMNVR